MSASTPQPMAHPLSHPGRFSPTWRPTDTSEVSRARGAQPGGVVHPVVNCFIGNFDTGFSCSIDTDCDPVGIPSVCSSGTCIVDLSVDEKTEFCDETTTLMCDLEVELDGARLYPVSGGMPLLGAVSPPTPGFLFGEADSELIASGYWALLSPLTAGGHTLRFSGGVRGGDGVCGSAREPKRVSRGHWSAPNANRPSCRTARPRNI